MMSRDELKKYTASGDISLIEAMKKIDANGQLAIFVVDDDMHLLGSVSDGDIRRSVVADANLEKPIKELMCDNPVTVSCLQKWDDNLWQNEQWLTLIPVVDSENRVVDIKRRMMVPEETRKETTELAGVPVVIMAGGKGTRLYPYTKILPKPLIPIGDTPILERIIAKYRCYGIDEFFLTVNYKKRLIKAYFDELSPDYKIVYIEENTPLGTAGSLKYINGKVGKPIIVANCDVLIEADYAEMYQQHISSKSALTIVSAIKQVKVPYGVLHVGDQGKVEAIEEKPTLSYLINTGMYILNSEFVSLIPQNKMYHMTDLAETLIAMGEKVAMYPISEDSFLDMGEFEEMKHMEEKLEEATD